MVYKLCILKLISINIIIQYYIICKTKGVNKIMENEKSVYELRLEEKDKIINFQQNIINKLIKTNVLTGLILAVVMIVFTLSYFWSDYSYQGVNVSGTNNNTVTDNQLDTSSIDTNTDD